MKLERFAYLPEGTFGRLEIEGRTYYTVEQPWNNNEPFKSCLPEALYSLVPHDSPSRGQTVALVNESIGVTQYKENGTKRYACLIHAANWPKDVQGCIGIGLAFLISDNQAMVTSSKVATKEVLNYIESHVIDRLEITSKNAYD